MNPTFCSDHKNPVLILQQQLLCLIDTDPQNIINNAGLCLFLKFFAQMILAEVGNSRQIIQADLLTVVLMDVIEHVVDRIDRQHAVIRRTLVDARQAVVLQVYDRIIIEVVIGLLFLGDLDVRSGQLLQPAWLVNIDAACIFEVVFDADAEPLAGCSTPGPLGK